MKAEDVTDTLQLVMAASGCDQARVVHKPRLLSDNGSSYISADLAEWLVDKGMQHVRGAPQRLPTSPMIQLTDRRAVCLPSLERKSQGEVDLITMETHRFE